jgi:Na+-translocating ferredoxin:NAD+ oxidoreductase RnfE subunit
LTARIIFLFAKEFWKELKVDLHVILHIANVLTVVDITLKAAYSYGLAIQVYNLVCFVLGRLEPLRRAGSPLRGVLLDLCILFYVI